MSEAEGQPARDRHLFGPGPKRILALDGGGTRGIIAVAFLERLEALLRQRHPARPGLLLCDYFDLIGGTSTGAIIAAGLALGMEVAEVRRMYLELAPRVFRRRPWRGWAIDARFSDAPLLALLRAHLGVRSMDSADLRTGLAIVTKRLDTGSPWVISNSPRAPYWDDPDSQTYTGNRRYDLATLVRASTAAPLLFRPERIAVTTGEPPGLFIDGGVSPYNDPALLLLMLATLRAYGLCWPLGADRLLMVSVGTGAFAHRLSARSVVDRLAVGLAGHALAGLIDDGQRLTLTMMQWLSQSSAPWTVNSEVGDLRGDLLAGTPLLSFERFNLRLEAAALRAVGERADLRTLARLRDMAGVAGMADNYRIAASEAARQVVDDRIARQFDLA